MTFDKEEAIKIANWAISVNAGRSLSDIELIVLRGAWDRLEYDQIAAQNQYSTSYVSNDIAPKLWKSLTNVLGEKVRKSNFKAALKRFWEKTNSADTSSSLQFEMLNMHTALAQDKVRQSNLGGKFQIIDRVESPQNSILSYLDVIPNESYITRPPVESNCYNALLKPGALLQIKAPNQMGKTLLVNYLLYQLKFHNYRTVYISLKLIDRYRHLVDLNQFLRWFCLNINRELGIAGQLEEYWDVYGLGAKVSCTSYFEQYLLTYSNSPLVLCLDDIDFLFPYPEIYEDFLGLLRSWYEKTRSRRIWKKFRLVIVHATDVYIRLTLHQSPFNVGVSISLPEFTLKQAQAFAKEYQLEGTIEQVGPLLEWVGGHPYLLKLAFAELVHRPSNDVADLLAELPTNSGIYGSHLQELLLNLGKDPALAIALQQVVRAQNGVLLKPIVAYKLQSMGLISLTGNVARSRCRLYSHYFAEQLESSV